MIQVYPAIFTPNDDGSITINFPDLDCTTEGKSIANAMYMARDALALWLDTQEMLGDTIPAASPVRSIQVDDESYVVLIDADPEVYARQRKNVAVRRTISLPKWLDEEAAARHLSLSAVLQEALTTKVNAQSTPHG